MENTRRNLTVNMRSHFFLAKAILLALFVGVADCWPGDDVTRSKRVGTMKSARGLLCQRVYFVY